MAVTNVCMPAATALMLVSIELEQSIEIMKSATVFFEQGEHIAGINQQKSVVNEKKTTVETKLWIFSRRFRRSRRNKIHNKILQLEARKYRTQRMEKKETLPVAQSTTHACRLSLMLEF